MQTTSRKGNVYFITFTDEYSHHLTVKFLKSKSEAFSALKAYWQHAQAVSGETPNYLRTDGGGEYGSHKMAEYL